MSVTDTTVYLPGLGNIRFDNLLEVTWDSLRSPFTRDGDSGSLVFLIDTLEAVGLHFAGGILQVDGKKVGVSYACSLTNVLKLFDAELL